MEKTMDQIEVRKGKVILAIQGITDVFNAQGITHLEGAVAMKTLLNTLKERDGIDIDSVRTDLQ